MFSFGKRDFSDSKYSLYIVTFVVAVLIVWSLITSINRIIKIEKTIKATYKDKKIEQRVKLGDRSQFTFLSEGGKKFSVKINHNHKMKNLGSLKKGQEVELLVSRGLFWAEIKEIRNGDNVYKVF
ncbi:MAG: hypothetical protein ACLFQV_14065 [Vulcanimicrobiota bacterium]